MMQRRFVSPSWGEDDARFREELRRGRQWQFYVSTFLAINGVVSDLEPEYAMGLETGGKGVPDLVLCRRLRFEVKSVGGRAGSFHRASEWQFATSMCGSVGGWDRKVVVPDGVVIVSRETGAMVWHYGPRVETFTVIPSGDAMRGKNEPQYAVRKSALRDIEELVSRLRRFQDRLDATADGSLAARGVDSR